MRKKIWILALLLGCLLLAGCQETPEEDVIVQKQDVEEQLEENTELPEDGTSLREYLEAPETVDLSLTPTGYQAFNAEGILVTVPEATGLPSASMSRYSFDEAYLERAAKYLFKDADIYKYEEPVMTKSDYQMYINEMQALIDASKAENATENAAENASEIDIADMESYIDEMTAEMAGAPETWTPKNEPIEYVFDSDGNFRAKATVDGSDAELTVVDMDTYSYLFYNLDDPSALYGDLREDDEGLTVQEGVTNRCQYTKEEAIALCEETISELLPDDNFVLDYIYDQYDQNKRWETMNPESAYTVTDIYGYSISFTRQINDVKETKIAYAGTDDEGAAEGYIPFGYETLFFNVTDKGIIYFSWDNCMQMDEVTYSNVSVLSFPQIKTAIETNLPLRFADLGAADEIFTITVSEIRLGLMCLRNKNDNNSYTMIPVWDVFSNDYDGQNAPILCINAIDGSVIDRGLRY